MLKRSMIAVATALAIGGGALAASAAPAAADNYGFYLRGPGYGFYAGKAPRHYYQHRYYSGYGRGDCWGWSKRLHQRVWVCGPGNRYRGGSPWHGPGPY